MRIDRINISEQVKELRNIADYWKDDYEPRAAMRKAADTIEALSAKLKVANKGQIGNNILKEIREKAQELSNQHWGDDERHLIGKGIQCMCIQSENIINTNMERLTKDCSDKWIYCGDGNNLPKEREWYMTTCVVNNGDPFSTELYFNGKNFDTEEIENEYYALCTILAWQPLPNPYHRY